MYTRLTKISLLLISFLALFLLRYYTVRDSFREGERVEITTRVATEPVLSGKRQKFTIGKLRVYLPRFPEVHYGDKIKLEGVVKKGKAGLFVVPEEFSVVEEAGTIPALKQRILSFYQSTLPEPEASLVSGITLGTKSNLPEDFFNSLKSSGTLHVVVASGMNVTLVAGFLISILVLFIRRPFAIPIAIAGIWVYVALVGFEAALIRAAIMGSLAFLAQAIGRIREAWWGLGIAALVMILFNPLWISDLGFLLSFGATAGILAFERPIRNRLKILPVLREDLSTTLAAQIVTTPILFASFGQFSPVSPLVNALVLWTVAPIMVISVISGLLGLIFESLGRFLLLFSYPLATYFVRIVSIF